MAWWDGAVGYEIYLRSYTDSDGDGTGDLPGVTSRLDHLADLGVDLLWITPAYPSPGHDHGYDVSDYTRVADVFGGDEALDVLLEQAHARGLRVIMDIVPNHCSSEHPWFQRALEDPTAPERGFFHFVDGLGEHGEQPPNNWVSHFGGTAWTRDPDSGQWWLHLFLPEQPDLNWDNPAVRDAFDEVLVGWFARGVDGFRIDVAHALVKDSHLRDNDWPDPLPDVANPLDLFNSLPHTFDLDQPGVTDIYERWHALAARHDAHLVGEVYLLEPSLLERYVADGRLHRSFYFNALRTGWDIAELRPMVHAGVTHGRGRFAWPMGSHDNDRAATRFGGGEVGRRRQSAYLALLCALPGTPYLYQGDEFGLENGVLPPGAAQDPVAVNNPGATGRDGTRTPIVWDDTPGRGFTSGTPWLPFGMNHGTWVTPAVQRGDTEAALERTRELLHTRRGCATMLATNEVTWMDVADTIAFRRGDVVVACNVGGPPTKVPVPDGDLIHATGDGVVIGDGVVVVPMDTTIWWRA